MSSLFAAPHYSLSYAIGRVVCVVCIYNIYILSQWCHRAYNLCFLVYRKSLSDTSDPLTDARAVTMDSSL